MGMYTKLILGAQLKRNTPKEVIDTLLYYIASDHLEPPEWLQFKTKSGRNPIRRTRNSYFAVDKAVVHMWEDEGVWVISSRCSLKNYENEFEDFLTWLKPYVDQGSGANEIYAMTIYEESTTPTLYTLGCDHEYDEDETY